MATLAPVRPTLTKATGPVLGGEAWVVPHEPGRPAWITVGAPRIAVTDRRGASAAR